MDPRLAMHQPTDEKGMFKMYKNPQYVGNRRENRSLILHISDFALHRSGFTAGTFDLELDEEFRIYRTTDVYLDHMTSYCIKPPQAQTSIENGYKSSALILHVDQLPTKTVSTTNSTDRTGGLTNIENHNRITGGILVTNESKATETPADAAGKHETLVHRGRKHNYVCTLNSQTLTKLSGTVKSIAENGSINDILFRQGGENDISTNLFFEFVFVEREE